LKAGRVPLWSSEALTVGSPRRRRRRAENFRAVFGDAKVVITLRHPLRFVESMYLHKLKAGAVGNGRRFGMTPRYFEIDEWLRNNSRCPENGALAHLEYAQTIEIFADVFGREAIGVFLFEQFVEDPAAFIDSLCRFIGIDSREGVALGTGKRENTRLTTGQLQQIKGFAQPSLRSTVFRFSSRARRRRILGMDAADAGPHAPGARAGIPVDWRQRILDESRQGNQQLVREWNLPLDRYDYPL
jgi:hypothetical protein